MFTGNFSSNFLQHRRRISMIATASTRKVSLWSPPSSSRYPPPLLTTPFLLRMNSAAVRMLFIKGQLHPRFSNLHVSLFHTEQSQFRSNQSPVPEPQRPIILPNLMDFPLIMWPSILMTIRNWFFHHFVIRPYMDKEFELEEFIRGARQAVSLVSHKLVSGEVDDLEGLVDPSTLMEVKRKLSTFSVYQRELLSVSIEDIFFAFPYQIGIIIPDSPEPLHRQATVSQVSEDDDPDHPPQKRLVEITVVFHIMRGFADKSAAGEMKSLREFIRSEERNNVMVCNYRFLRDFTKGVSDPTWVINMINHFLPADHYQKS